MILHWQRRADDSNIGNHQFGDAGLPAGPLAVALPAVAGKETLYHGKQPKASSSHQCGIPTVLCDFSLAGREGHILISSEFLTQAPEGTDTALKQLKHPKSASLTT